MSANIKEMTSS